MKKERAQNLKTRPDLDDESWLKLIERLPENKDLNVRTLYRRMLRWCEQKGQTPTRRRLLKWLDNEREAVPIKMTDPDCTNCKNERWIKGNLENWPCPTCSPERYAAWRKERGK